MIKEVTISNFKSVRKLSLSLGQFNIFIGSNGSGKSNILEAITFGGAASADKLDNEFLGSRGIRTSNAQLMKSAFSKKFLSEPINITFKNGKGNIQYTIEEEIKPLLKWYVKEKKEIEDFFNNEITKLFHGNINSIKWYNELDNKNKDQLTSFANNLKSIAGEEDKEGINKFIKTVFSSNTITELYKENFYNDELANFLIYSPEISYLRKFEEESQIKPLGIKGEGLFNVIQIFNETYGKETMEQLKAYLHAIEWFDDFDSFFEKKSGRRGLIVKDRYLKGIGLNQTNVNEGFLFLLFYVSIILSKETPAFFAIDNIEASFHPALCKELTKRLIQLAKEHNKQIIITTHNPFVLDGLNLNNSDERLFVIRRNSEGETIADHISTPPKNVKLSEAWIRGYIGGQPETIG